VRSPTGVNTFSVSLNELFGTDRQRIAERLSDSLDAQKLYEELDDRLQTPEDGRVRRQPIATSFSIWQQTSILQNAEFSRA
jgi:hypothetical protein